MAREELSTRCSLEFGLEPREIGRDDAGDAVEQRVEATHHEDERQDEDEDDRPGREHADNQGEHGHRGVLDEAFPHSHDASQSTDDYHRDDDHSRRSESSAKGAIILAGVDPLPEPLMEHIGRKDGDYQSDAEVDADLVGEGQELRGGLVDRLEHCAKPVYSDLRGR